jgi:hypothetical protein
MGLMICARAEPPTPRRTANMTMRMFASAAILWPAPVPVNAADRLAGKAPAAGSAGQPGEFAS